ncbi:discoidin domain-containing protein [Lysinibacillus sp. UBA5990]|uniref:discoidin domain-containing protein n=1 Tax=Lysinibacillus sp. UBA5990 TaxID=1946773 RepID=UPI0025BDF5BD|nr:discoidin domain-containing protein [Lysinibacillus sp. UBA5990]
MAALFDKWTFEESSLLGEGGCKLNVYRNPTFTTDKVKGQVKTLATFGSQSGFISAQRFTDNTNVTAICAFRLNVDSIYTVHYECQVLGITDGTYLGSAITVSRGNKIGVGYYGTGHVLVPSTVSIQKGKWYIIAYRKTGNVIDVFLDGQLIHTIIAHSAHARAPYLTGQYCNSSGIHSMVNRSYTELTVYEVSLSNEEIRAKSEGIKNKMLIFHDGKYKRWNEEKLAEKGGSILPVFISDTQDGIVASSNSVYTTYSAYKALDKKTDTYWLSNGVPTATAPVWLMLDLGKPTTLTGYAISIYARTTYNINTHYFQGSNNGIDFETIHSRVNSPLTEILTYINFPSVSFRYVRVLITKYSGSSGRVSIQELELIGEGKPNEQPYWSTIELNEVNEQGLDSLLPLAEYKIIELDPMPMVKLNIEK